MARAKKAAAAAPAKETPITETPIVEEAVEKKPAPKKPTAKKAADKTPAVKKTAEERKVVIQYNGSEVAGTALIDKAKEVAGIENANSIVVYVRPEINKVYYVIDDNTYGNFDLF